MTKPLISRISIFFVAAMAMAQICAAQASLAGVWKGTLEANGATVRIVWHVEAAADGTLTSTFDNLDENVFGIKVKTTTVTDNNISMTVDDQIQANGQDVHIVGSLTGTIDKDGTEVNATWSQSQPEESSGQIHFVRANQAAPTPPSAFLVAPGLQFNFPPSTKAGSD